MTTRKPRPQEGQDLVTGGRQGLTADRIRHEIARQRGLCALCARPLGGEFFVDHDHVVALGHPHPPQRGCPKCFRGIVCRRDNNILAWAGDSPELLERMAAYIRLSRAGALHG